MNARGRMILAVFVMAASLCLLVTSQRILAHCDTLDGPVVADARAALAKGDIALVLKWVRPDYEKEVREAFDKTLVVRKQSPEAKELADMYFFETIVRLHRAGEGAGYTGLKPSGSIDPAISAADQALETGSVDKLVADITSEMAEGIRARFTATFEARKHVSESVEAGRKYVAAYVDYVHFVEGMHGVISGEAVHGEAENKEEGHK